MAKNLDLTGFDGKIASEFKKARKTKKGSKGIMEEKTVVETMMTETETDQATSTATSMTTETVSTGTEEATEVATSTQEQMECSLPTGGNPVESNSAETNSSVIETVEEEPTFTIPLSSLNTLNKLTAFIGEVYTYSYLINKATGATEPSLFIDSRMCDDLAEAISLEEFLTLLKEFLTTKETDQTRETNPTRETEYVKGIELKDNTLIFTCFQNLMDTGMKKAVASLFRLMAKAIMSVGEDKKKRLNLHKVQIKQPENEKFVFRTWLTRLGWKGSEGKMERNLLYRNLNGNTAFCTEESKIRWEAKHKTERRGRIEETVVEDAEASVAEAEEATAIATEEMTAELEEMTAVAEFETTVAEIEPEIDMDTTVEAKAV